MSMQVIPLADPGAPPGERRWWLAAGADGCPLGTAALRLPSSEGRRHLAELELHVHPAERRRGVGRRLLDAAAEAARDDGRRTLVAEAEAGSPGEAFLTATGFRTVLTLAYARLPLATADLARLQAEAGHGSGGYRLVTWDGTVPEHLAESFAHSRRAMDDMPLGESGLGRQVWDVDRVRAAAAAVAARGEHLHTVAAVDAASDTIVGFVEIVVPADRTGDGLHYGTAVLPEHRQRGLARWMTARAVLDVRAAHPALDGLVVDTAIENAAMRRVNAALGYVPTHRVVQCERT